MPSLKSLLFISTAMAVMTMMAAEAPKPEIRDGVWQVPFRYWSGLSPVVHGTGGFDLLCEVQSLGKEVPEPSEGPARFRTGKLKVLEVLRADTGKFPAIKTLHTLEVEGCEKLQPGDRLIVFINAEAYEGGYVIDRHRGTNSLIGHRLSRPDEGGSKEPMDTVLLTLVRKGRLNVSDATPDELRALAHMDPAGVCEALIRQLEAGRLIKRTNE